MIYSLKLDKKFWQVFAWDLLFVVAALVILTLTLLMLNINTKSLDPAEEASARLGFIFGNSLPFSGQAADDIGTVVPAFNTFVLGYIFSILVGAALLSFVGAVIKSITWSKILGKKLLNKVQLLRLIGITFLWNALWLGIMLISTYGLRFSLETITKIVITEIFLYFYFSFILYPVYFRNLHVWRSIQQAFRFGVLKFFTFGQAFAATFLTFVLISFILAYVSSHWIPSQIFFTTSRIIFYIIFLVWVKIYMNRVVEAL